MAKFRLIQLAFLLLLLRSSFVCGMENVPVSVVIYLNKQGPVTELHLIHSLSPKEQMAVHYCVDQARKGGTNEGANNPSFYSCSIALFNRSKKRNWVYSESISVGQGTLLNFDDGIIEAESLTYDVGRDPLCCPSQKKKEKFSTARGKIVPISD